jgi:integrase
LRVLHGLPRISGKDGEPRFVFTTSGDTPVSGFSRAKANLDRQILILIKREAEAIGADPSKAKPVQPWRVHDLRRTMVSGLARLGVSLPVIERCLNHVSGSFGGIVGVYQRHDFADEKRQALVKWAEFVAELVQ